MVQKTVWEVGLHPQKMCSLVSACLGMSKAACLPVQPKKGDGAGFQDLPLTEPRRDNQNSSTQHLPSILHF